MSKLRLQIEDITVESFSTQDAGLRRGTVAGHATTGVQIICDCPTNGYENTCRTCSCEGTCNASCNGSCNSCVGCGSASCGGTCDDSCLFGTCGATCEGNSCQWCTVPPQIVC